LPVGIEVVSHDPSDLGGDNKGLAHRKGILVTNVEEREIGTVNEGGDWASSYVNQHPSVDAFVWDGDGMGVALRAQFNKAFSQKKIRMDMFRGSLSGKAIDRADEIYDDGTDDPKKKKTYKEVFRNNRSMYYWLLRDRCWKTYQAVVKGTYINPDDIISFSSDIEGLDTLRSELCKIPLKYNPLGFIQIMSKKEMLALDIPSPNMADSVMMLFANQLVVNVGGHQVTVGQGSWQGAT